MRHTTINAAARELRRGKYISKFPKIQHLAPKKNHVGQDPRHHPVGLRRPCSYRLSMPRFRRRQNRKSVSANIKNEFDNMNDPTYKEHFLTCGDTVAAAGETNMTVEFCRQFPNRLTNIFGISKITKIHPKSTLTALNRRYPICPARHSGRGAKAISAFFCKVSRHGTAAGRAARRRTKPSA